MIQGISFDNQVLSAKLLRMILSGYGDGILDGCALSYSGKTLTIGDGCMIAKGGAFAITGGETVTVSATSGYARVKAVLNMNGTASTSSFNQVSFVVDTASSVSGFASLTKNDINRSGTKYEMEVCIVSCGSSGITGIVRKAGNPKAILTSDMYGSTLPSNAQTNQLFYKKV